MTQGKRWLVVPIAQGTRSSGVPATRGRGKSVVSSASFSAVFPWAALVARPRSVRPLSLFRLRRRGARSPPQPPFASSTLGRWFYRPHPMPLFSVVGGNVAVVTPSPSFPPSLPCGARESLAQASGRPRLPLRLLAGLCVVPPPSQRNLRFHVSSPWFVYAMCLISPLDLQSENHASGVMISRSLCATASRKSIRDPGCRGWFYRPSQSAAVCAPGPGEAHREREGAGILRRGKRV